ncbi:MAG: hypothetical protein LBR34_03190 [Prevotella sp.]|jgi:uncharacterized protein YfcZ (UPF0381/DUF406 family)|nr:hypothetical protein [Prevotella sp.]
MSKLINDQIAKAEMLISGLKKYSDIAKNAGLDMKTLVELGNESLVLSKQNAELEKMMSEVKAAARNANKKLAEVKNMFQSVKKQVKLNTDPSKWGLVGIMDKR